MDGDNNKNSASESLNSNSISTTTFYSFIEKQKTQHQLHSFEPHLNFISYAKDIHDYIPQIMNALKHQDKFRTLGYEKKELI